jgi:peptidoglycan/LPS O-acetylase OafA/YrhL
MKNKKFPFAVLIPSVALMLYFIFTGVSTMNKYEDTPGDWHFIAAFAGVCGFVFLLAVLAYRLIKKPIKE